MTKRKGLTRRDFLAAGTGLFGLSVLGGLQLRHLHHQRAPGQILGANHQLGHRLWQGSFPEPVDTLDTDILIIGSGIAGLSAAWKLKKSGLDDILILEMESVPGGTSLSGSNPVSAYPWGAHYVPLLSKESKTALELFQDLGIVQSFDKGMPVYNETYLCHDPHERLYMQDRWQEGLVPQVGTSSYDQEQFLQFFDKMEQFKSLKGNDGKKVFALPVAYSSHDPEYLKLDTISMSDWLKDTKWDSPYLRWYLNYCCRSDYGAQLENVSAWAALHYFASRNGQAANADSQTVLTWPEGNGFIVNALTHNLQLQVRTSALAYKLVVKDDRVSVYFYDALKKYSYTVEAKAVLLATPRHVAEKIYPSGYATISHYFSPWMVATITLSKLPEGEGTPLAWNNLVYDSRLLGYVVATHQTQSQQKNKTVITYYWPLDHLNPEQARKEALGRSYEAWRQIIMEELLRIHPELSNHVERCDIWIWGHGMIRPIPNYIWNEARKKNNGSKPPVFYAHSDMSGVPLFEEANYQGVCAAEDILSYLKKPFTTSL